MTPESLTYPGYRYPAEIIGDAVWLYHVFSLNLRDVELILAEWGIVVSYESIRCWCHKFGADFARKLRRRRPKPGDVWHLDEVYLRINGVLHLLWRAVDQHGVVLDLLVQDRRNATAAKRFFKRLLAGLKYRSRTIITDGLRSYGVAHRDLLPDARHRTSRYLNNRAENSHRPTRCRERQMQRFKSPRHAQCFLSAHAMIYGHFPPRRHLMTAAQYRRTRTSAFQIWRQETCVQIAGGGRASSATLPPHARSPDNLTVPFSRFLTNGRICLTNNAAERELRGVALGRKAWMFAGSDRGGDRAAAMYSLIATAKLNGVDPRAWLADVLARIADHPASRLHELLPWNWKTAQAAPAAKAA